MKSEMLRKWAGVFVLIGLLSISVLEPVQEWLNLPDEISMESYEKETATLKNIEQKLPSFFSLENKTDNETVQVFAGSYPIKSIAKKHHPEIEVIPGGQSIGVRLNSQGVLVVGFHLIETGHGQKSPAEAAGVKKGDIIVKINQKPVEDMREVASVLQSPNEDKEIHIELIRNGERIHKTIQPTTAATDDSKQLGMYIRDSTAGVGTMTFFEPKTGYYGALGHVIADVDTKKPVSINEGEIVRSSVTAIDKGGNGSPGEKQASLNKTQQVLGTITKNNTFGIYGELEKNHDLVREGREPMPIAHAGEVKEGPAKILTVVENEEVEEFDIEIVRSTPQKHAATKGMVIKVTDERLLEKTGGIIQGMSGSPIIQNDKIVGAVTHVFINDSTTGYGSHIEWMLEEAGVDMKREEKVAS